TFANKRATPQVNGRRALNNDGNRVLRTTKRTGTVAAMAAAPGDARKTSRRSVWISAVIAMVVATVSAALLTGCQSAGPRLFVVSSPSTGVFMPSQGAHSRPPVAPPMQVPDKQAACVLLVPMLGDAEELTDHVASHPDGSTVDRKKLNTTIL